LANPSDISWQDKLSRSMRRADFESAEDLCFEQLLEEPDNVLCLTALGQIAHKRGDLSDAIILYGKAILSSPDLIEPRLLLARALLDSGEIPAAGSCLVDALSLDETHIEARSLLADQTLRSGNIEVAAEIYVALFEEQVRDKGVLEGLGNAYRMLGRREKAIEIYQLWAELYPSDGNAWWSLANLKNYTFSLSEVQKMESHLVAGASTEAQMRFALGVAWENKESFQTAFKYYEEANRLTHRIELFDSDAHDELIDRLFAFKWEAGNATYSSAIPIFVVGMPRSGTTLIEQILASHSEVVGLGELSILGDLVAELELSGNHYPDLLLSLDHAEIEKIGRRYLQSSGVTSGFFVDKMPNNFLLIGLIRLILPQAKIVHARRLPIATCFSCFKQRFGLGQAYTYDLACLVRYYSQYSKLMDFWEQCYSGSIHHLDYESLVLESEEEIKSLLDFCDLSFETACFDFSSTDRIINSASSEQVREPLYRNSLEHWRNFEPFLRPFIEALSDSKEAISDSR